MPIPLNQLLDCRKLEESPDHVYSAKWRTEVFARAYGRGGPFDKVVARLSLGFSVMVYLPGNCILPAAEYVKELLKDAGTWEEVGKHTGQPNALSAALAGAGAFVGKLLQALVGGTSRPRAIFHNLDLWSDGQGGLDPAAKEAYFSLLEATRQGVVLGLADREAGALPMIERAFNETMWLNETPTERFHLITPKSVGRKFGSSTVLPDGLAWMLASRLRWTDPVRAARIMHAARNCASLGDFLSDVWRSTRTVEFREAEQAFPELPEELRGYDPQLVQDVRDQIIRPFQDWLTFQGESEEDCRRVLAMLPRGAIFEGPSGTGKTRLAQWIARELGLPVWPLDSTHFKASRWGEAEERVHRVFQHARRAAPCVLVLDDADDLLPDREAATGSVAAGERGIANAALQEIQGFCGSLDGVLILMTTNRVHAVDRAVQARMGFCRRVPYPTRPEQVEDILAEVELQRRVNVTANNSLKKQLVNRFMGPMVRTPEAMKGMPSNLLDPTVRVQMQRNLFSPREIDAAVQMLRRGGNGGVAGGFYQPTQDDLDRVIRYYDTLV